MKTTMALVALLVLAAACRLSEADDHTFVTNLSSRAIRATTSYPGGKSKFINRLISAGGRDVDEYTENDLVTITLSVDGSASSKSVRVDPDRSIFALNNDDASAVIIYEAKYGTLTQTDGGVLATLFP